MNDFMGEFFRVAPEIKPYLNVGFPMDMATGVYYKGKHGQNVLNGGILRVMGYGGRGNMYKSTIMHTHALAALNYYSCSTLTTHDAEGSTQVSRYYKLAERMDYIGGIDLVAECRLMFTDLSTMYGNEWFKAVQLLAEHKAKEHKKFQRTSQFVDSAGKTITCAAPTLAELDSITQMSIEEVNKLFAKAEVGESDLNAEAMRSSMAKNQMLTQIPHVCSTGNVYMMMSAHVGDEIVLDKYAPSTKKLAMMKGNMKFKSTPEKFTFLTEVLLFARNIEVMINQSTKAPEFPRDSSDNAKGDTDLQAVTVQFLRNKQGPSGGTYDYVVSQGEGIHYGLTMLRYLKANKEQGGVGWGMSGHDKSYYLDIYPEVKMSRTTVRRLLDEDPKLVRAFEITAYIHQYFGSPTHNPPPKLRCTMSELYTQIKEKGYDWDILLQTQNKWSFEEEMDNYAPYLSEKDLLEMRVDEYRPFWMAA